MSSSAASSGDADSTALVVEVGSAAVGVEGVALSAAVVVEPLVSTGSLLVELSVGSSGSSGDVVGPAGEVGKEVSLAVSGVAVGSDD
jgi:hypothetical protein